MAGYDGYSKSNNALNAEYEGKMTASALAKHIGHGATAKGVNAVLIPCEWHHTSSRYNRTNYFDLDGDASDLAAESDSADIEAAKQTLIEKIIDASKSETKKEEIIESAHVEWIEWGGTRNHPKATKCTADHCRVVVKGQFATITAMVQGLNFTTIPPQPMMIEKTFRKKLDANGFSFRAE